jgi:exosome complex RNA-binding protein Csl4
MGPEIQVEYIEATPTKVVSRVTGRVAAQGERNGDHAGLHARVRRLGSRAANVRISGISERRRRTGKGHSQESRQL